MLLNCEVVSQPTALSNHGIRPHVATMLHMMKLAVGIRDKAHLASVQAERAAAEPPLRHRTRNMPKRAAEILDGGSMYWVVAGAMVVRQRIIGIAEDCWEDGSACAALFLDPALVAVEGRTMKPFQGWRYLAAADAPSDLAAGIGARGDEVLPPALRRDLRELCLI